MLTERQIWFNIAKTEGIGPSAFQKIWRRLAERGSGPEVLVGMTDQEVAGFLDLSSSLSQNLSLQLSTPLDEPLVDRPVQLLLPGDDDFPNERFRSAVPPLPAVLWAVGDVALLSSRGGSIAIAGSRDASDEAIEVSHRLAKTASELGIVVVSGLAPGVDSAAHQGAVIGKGGTIGVMASGILRHNGFRPDESDLVCLISQFEPNDAWSGPRAMVRNATIAGLSDRVVVCASGLTGGSWEMAQLCLKRSKPLYVLDLEESEAPGNQQLIRAGARAVPRDDFDVIWSGNWDSPIQPTLF